MEKTATGNSWNFQAFGKKKIITTPQYLQIIKDVAQFALEDIFSSITSQLNRNKDVIFLTFPRWWIKQLPFCGYLWCFSTGYTSRWRRRLRRCRWPSAPVTSPSSGAWQPAPWRTNPSRACSVSEQSDHKLHFTLKIITAPGWAKTIN